MTKNQYSAGLLMLAAGIVILLGKLGIFSFIGAVFWPIFLLIPGVLLHVLFFGRLLPAAVLIPGGILSAYALLFLYCNVFGWSSLRVLWPVFILGAAVGIYEYHLFEMSRPRSALIAAVLLAGIAFACFIIMLLWGAGIYFIALALIAVGAWLAFWRKARW